MRFHRGERGKMLLVSGGEARNTQGEPLEFEWATKLSAEPRKSGAGRAGLWQEDNTTVLMLSFAACHTNA